MTFTCTWCGKEWHNEDRCYQKRNNQLPLCINRRNQITTDIMRNYILRKHFKHWVTVWFKMPVLEPNFKWGDAADDV